MPKINYILEGQGKGGRVYNITSDKCLTRSGGWDFRKPYVVSYEVIDESNKEKYSVWKGALGVALFGGLGVIAGLRGKKSKEYMVAITWKDGEKSLIYIDEDHYKTLVKSLF